MVSGKIMSNKWLKSKDFRKKRGDPDLIGHTYGF